MKTIPLNIAVKALSMLSLVAIASSSLCAENPATTAEPRNTWMDQHNRIVQSVEKTPDAKLVFVGDSITQNWNSRGRDVWRERYEKLPALNLGVSGDKTENILWRLQNGELEGLSPELIVVLAGTNNIHRDSVEQIAEGVEAIVNELLLRCPDSQILLMGIFPRGGERAPERPKIQEINAIISQMASNPRVDFLDIQDQLLTPEGTMDTKLFPDYLHPLSEGYVIWADAIDPYLVETVN